MNDQDRITITKCLPELVSSLQINDEFTNLLEEKQIFSRAMIKDIQSSDNTPRTLLIDLQKRGPKSYKKFLEVLSETGQHAAIDLLAQKRIELGFPAHEVTFTVAVNKQTKNASASPSPTPTSPEYQNKVLCPPSYPEDVPSSPAVVIDAKPPTDYESMEIVVKPSTLVRTGEGIYLHNGQNPRGLALILNYKHFTKETNLETREGSEKDIIHLDLLLQALGYRVAVRSDLKLSQTLAEIKDFANDEAHAQADSSVVAIMSHGKEGTLSQGTLVYTAEGSVIGSEEVLRRFNGENCPNLKGKPKIFLFQFCRGDQRNSGLDRSNLRSVVSDGRQVKSSEQEVDRTFEDMLIAYSTLPGHVSYREEGHGTWFIKAICTIFMDYACEYHVHRLLTMVDELIKRWTALEKHNGYCKQTTEISQRGFNRKFYFNPGLFTCANPMSS